MRIWVNWLCVADPGDITCEMDEYAHVVKALKASGIIRDHSAGLFSTHKNSFSGKDFVDWVVRTKQLGKALW